MTLGIVANSPAEWIAFVEQQRGFRIDESSAGNGRRDFSGSAIEPSKAARECAAEDAFLDPRLIFVEFFVRGKAGEFGAGSGATWGTIKSFARALDEIAGVSTGDGWRAK